MYKPEVVIDTLKRMKESEYGFSMQHWCTTPEGTGIALIPAVTEQVGQRHIYIPAPSGTSFCFAGFLAMFEIQRLSEASDSGTFNIGTVFTQNLALNSLGLGYNLQYSTADHYRTQRHIELQFEEIFFRNRIKTINGLRRVLKKEGLLQPV